MKAIPILPSRDFDRTQAFFESLGFRAGDRYDDYLIMSRENAVIHFFLHPETDPQRSIAGCYLRVSDADVLAEEWAAVLPSEGIPRIIGLEDKPWGMRELSVIDPDGNLFRVGHDLEPGG